MMGLDPFLPDHVLRLMSKEDRKALGKAGVTSEEAAQKQEAKSEKELQQNIVNLLHLRGVKRVVRSNMSRKTTTPVGTPDLLFVFGGQAFAWECKHGRGVVSDDQDKALLEFGEDGWNVWVITSVAEAKLILDTYERHSNPTAL